MAVHDWDMFSPGYLGRAGIGTGGATNPSPFTDLPQTLNIAGNHPDYSSLIQGDPTYQQMLGGLSASGAAAANSRRQSVRNALIQFGADPNMKFNDVYGDIDQATRDAAQQANTSGVSTMAQLGHQHAQALGLLHGALADRGVLASGEANQREGDENLRNTVAQTDAVNKLLQFLSGADQSYAQTAAGLQTQQANDLMSILPTVEAQYPTTNGVTATYNPSSGYYEDGSGNQYDWYGTHVGGV